MNTTNTDPQLPCSRSRPCEAAGLLASKRSTAFTLESAGHLSTRTLELSLGSDSGPHMVPEHVITEGCGRSTQGRDQKTGG